uniref:TTF-type domain-containing protein n=1 Tax=Latimeria chalumnae TaxID=7897 RepID=H3ADY7_LATCH
MIEQLLAKPFSGLNYQEKLEVKRLGPHQPDLKLEQSSKDRGKEYTCEFTMAWYEKKKWLCGSATRKSLFCFPCLLFGGELSWTQTGVNDLKHLSEKIKKHKSCKCHLDNSIMLAMFGSVNIATQLDKSYQVGIRKHNEEVDKNRYILSKLIDCVRFCGAFELALRGHDETESSLNPGLVDLVSSMDSAMEKHVKVQVFKGTSKTIQNELLDCMLEVTRDFIIQQLRNTEYVAIQADDTTDVSTRCQSVLVYQYIDGNGKIVERFYGFTLLKGSCAESIATVLLDQLNIVFPEHCEKQNYDGASVMRGESGGVQRKVRDRYPNAHYVHCYAHQLNLIMDDLSGFPAFFSHSPKRTQVLEDIVARRLPRGAATRWNFNIRTVNIIYEHREDLLECFKTIKCSIAFESTTICEARRFIRMLNAGSSLSFFFFFYNIMPHVDVLCSQLQKQDIDTVYVERVSTEFVSGINKVRESIEDLGSKLPDESEFPIRCGRRTETKTLKEVCDIIIVHAKERFAFTKHLVSAKLLLSDLFERHNQCFPLQTLTDTVQAYPMLNKERSHTELSVIYGKPEFCGASGGMALFRLFLENNLQDTFSETKLLRILITIPMTTVESERCFSTLKRIKTFLRNTMNQDQLNALVMLSMEKQLIQEIPDFNKRTIEKFAALKDRQVKFLYK